MSSACGRGGVQDMRRVSTLSRLLTDILHTLQTTDTRRRTNGDSSIDGRSLVAVPSQNSTNIITSDDATTTPHTLRYSSADVYEKALDLLLETSRPGDDVTRPPGERGRSRSPGSDVESILDALRETTASYFGDFTLRRVFSLDAEVENTAQAEWCRSRQSIPDNRRHSNISNRTDDDDTPNDGPADIAESHSAKRRLFSYQTWTLPLVKRFSASAIGRKFSFVFRRLNNGCKSRDSATQVEKTTKTEDEDKTGNEWLVWTSSSPERCSKTLPLATSQSTTQHVVSGDSLPTSGDDVIRHPSNSGDDGHRVSSSCMKRSVAEAGDDVTSHCERQSHVTCMLNNSYNGWFVSDTSSECSTDPGDVTQSTECPSCFCCSPEEQFDLAVDCDIDAEQFSTLDPFDCRRSNGHTDLMTSSIASLKDANNFRFRRRCSDGDTSTELLCVVRSSDHPMSRSSSCEVVFDDNDDIQSDLARRTSICSSDRRSFGLTTADESSGTEDSSGAYFDMDDDKLTAPTIDCRLLQRLMSRTSGTDDRRRRQRGRSVDRRKMEAMTSSAEHSSSEDDDSTDVRCKHSNNNNINKTMMTSLNDDVSLSDFGASSFNWSSSFDDQSMTSSIHCRHSWMLNDRQSDRRMSAILTGSAGNLSKCRNLPRVSSWSSCCTQSDVSTWTDDERLRLTGPLAETRTVQVCLARTSKIPTAQVNI